MIQAANHQVERVLERFENDSSRARGRTMILASLAKFTDPRTVADRVVRWFDGLPAPTMSLESYLHHPEHWERLVRLLSLDPPWGEAIAGESAYCSDWPAGVWRGADAPQLLEALLQDVTRASDEAALREVLSAFWRREWLRLFAADTLGEGSARQAAAHRRVLSETLMAAGFWGVVRQATSPQDAFRPEAMPLAVLAVEDFGPGFQAGPSAWMAIHSEALRTPRARDGWPYDAEFWTHRLETLRRLLESLSPWSPPMRFPLEHESHPLGGSMIQDASHWLDAVSLHGTTVHRVMLLHARPVAGNLVLARDFLRQSSAFVFPRYLTSTENASLSAWLRKLDRAVRSGNGAMTTGPQRTASTPHVLLRSIDAMIAALQLIHGSESPAVRAPDPGEALDALIDSGHLTASEYDTLAQAREIALRHTLRAQFSAAREGLTSASNRSSTASILASIPASVLDSVPGSKIDWAEWEARVRSVEQHLRGELLPEGQLASEESDLILDPDPDSGWACAVARRFCFQDPETAVRHLKELAVEDSQVLSSGRCRYFLASIASNLLQQIGRTPSPDWTLENLASTCRSIGAKGVLWELFSLHQPSMDLYVRLCGTSPYLIGILTHHPGMVDELLDSLMLGRLPNEQQLSRMLDELCRGADDIDAIVQSFKHTMHLTIGVRDILGKESVSETHRALADVADVCLQQTIQHHYNALLKRYGVPTLENGSPCRFSVLALGKLGSREPNYHSDVTVLFVYEGDGTTFPLGPMRHHQAIRNDYFFHQLAQRVANGVNRLTRYGRLYEIQNWVLSKESTSSLAWTSAELESHFLAGQEDAQQRLLLATARVMAGDATFQQSTQALVRRVLHARAWTEQDTRTMLAHRHQMEQTASERNLKRGPGGTLDVEMLSQILSLEQTHRDAHFLAPGTMESLERLKRCGRIAGDDALELRDAYNFLRGVESGLRLMNSKARHDLPSEPLELARLAYGLHVPDAPQLLDACEHYRHEVRRLFLKYLPAR